VLAPLTTELAARVGKAPITGIPVDTRYHSSNLRIPGIENSDGAYYALNSVLVMNFNTVYAMCSGNKPRPERRL